MPNLPAFCDTCGTAFASGFGGSGGMIFSLGCKSGPCPLCGGDGSIPDGAFKLDRTLVTLLSGPAASFIKINELKSIIENSRKSGEAPQATLAKVAEQNSTLGAIGSIMSPEVIPLYLGLILQLLTLIIQAQQPAPLTRDDAQRLVTAAVQASVTYPETGPSKEKTIRPDRDASCKPATPKKKSRRK